MKGLGLIICLVAAATSAGIARAPQVVVADSDFDFGRVLSGTLVEHQFVVKNERDVPLVIDEVRLTPPLTLVGAPSSVAAGCPRRRKRPPRYFQSHRFVRRPHRALDG
jgi:hypothetical protein